MVDSVLIYCILDPVLVSLRCVVARDTLDIILHDFELQTVLQLADLLLVYKINVLLHPLMHK